MVQLKQHIFLPLTNENKNHVKINKLQKVRFLLFQFQNENNMPSKDGIVHVNKQSLKLKDTILNILLLMQNQNKELLMDESLIYEISSSNVE